MNTLTGCSEAACGCTAVSLSLWHTGGITETAEETSHNREDSKIEWHKFCNLDIGQTSATRENYRPLQTLSGLIRRNMAEYRFIGHCTNRVLKGVREYK